MSQVTDFTKLHKRSKNKKRAKMLLAILLSLAGVYLAVSVSNDPNFVGLSSILTLFQDGPGYPLEAPGGKSLGMYAAGGNLVTFNETNLYMYGANGRENFSVQHRMANPQMAVRGNMVLSYDRGAKSYAAYSRSTPFASNQTDHPIVCGDISSGGEMVLATQSASAQSVVKVYNKNQKERYTWSSEDTVTAVAISENGKLVAIAACFVEDGVLNSKLTILNGDQTAGTRVFEDQLILSLRFQGERLQGVSDREAFLCDSKAKQVGQYQIREQNLAGYAIHDNGVVLLLGDYAQERRYTLLSLDETFSNVQGRAAVSQSLQKVKVSGDTILVLGSETLSQYSALDGSLLDSREAENIYDIQPMGGSVYCMTTSQLLRIPLESPNRLMTIVQGGPTEEEQMQTQKELELPHVEMVPGISVNEYNKPILPEGMDPGAPSDTQQPEEEPTVGESRQPETEQPQGALNGTAAGQQPQTAAGTSGQPQPEQEPAGEESTKEEKQEDGGFVRKRTPQKKEETEEKQQDSPAEQPASTPEEGRELPKEEPDKE